MVDNAIRTEIAAICSDAGWIRLAILFGSPATGRASSGSDFDVGVLASLEVPLAAELELASRISAVTRTEVDIVRLDSAEPLVAREVALHGVLIHE
jgi:predicted nucleotidyltransferase